MKLDPSKYKLTKGHKRDPIPGRKFKWLAVTCPECNEPLYEMPVCCGAPEGLIECSRCMYSIVPSKFYKEEK